MNPAPGDLVTAVYVDFAFAVCVASGVVIPQENRAAVGCDDPVFIRAQDALFWWAPEHEGVGWIRGRHAADSEEVQALLATYILREGARAPR